MEHKFIIEVGLRYVGPDEKQEDTKPQVAKMKITPEILTSLLTQLPAAMAAMQPKPTGHPPKSTGHPPKA